MTPTLEKAEALVNSIAAKIPLVEKTDLTVLAEIVQHLEELATLENLPRAFSGLAERTAKLVEHIILDEVSFEGGVKKLGQSLEKMRAAVATFRERSEAGSRGDSTGDYSTREATEDDAGEAEESGDLLVKFASKQQSVLDDFEAASLAFEKGSEEARDSIRRTLHTWKGEFGVLGLQAYGSLLHQVEERFGNDELEGESLLRLRDLLGQKLVIFSTGKAPRITTGEIDFVFNVSADTGTASQEREVHSVEKKGDGSPDERVPTLGDQAFDGDPTLMGDFVSESREHIDRAEPLLLELESNPTDRGKLNSIFRACHTIKGIAGFLGLREVSHLAHSIENLMDLARNGELALEPAHIDVLLEGIDCLRRLVDAVEKALSGGEFEIPSNYVELCSRLASPYELLHDGGVVVEDSSHKAGDAPVDRGGATQDDVGVAQRKEKGGDEPKVGRILVEAGKSGGGDVAGVTVSQNAAKQRANVEETIRVPVRRLDHLIDAIGEAVIAQSMVYADPAVQTLQDLTLRNKMAQAGLIMRQIQELSMSLRMVTVRGVFQKMARLVRDLSKKFRKEVEFITEGEDTELDKSVVENIGDPLMHMIRNAVDHGIETAEERRAAGKPERATVILRAYHKAGSVFIEVSDDGRGLDKDKILEKAVNGGLCGNAEGLSDQDVYRFVFAPGFSTAERITDVSGRGVGMDVVRKNIEALRGAVDINSERGRGTLFTIRLPLTLAIIDGMVIRLGNERYIIPALSIIESIRPEKNQVEKVAARGELIKFRGELLRFIRLKQVFYGREGTDAPQDGIAIIVEDVMGRRVALLVDE
ncbi:MAG: hypothetical protein GF344_12665, partial [Chitinivibrionales bacterium]|nr:hypothetical protein [Chitinivibrionales bacterium]MBD3357605.1 hypothetical protein [Chitinivibrionales bacterium]